MFFLISSIIASTIDNLLIAYCLRFIHLFSLAPLWFGFPAIIGWIYSYFRGCSFKDFKPFLQHPIQSFLYFGLSILGMIFWGLALTVIGVGSTSMIMQLGIVLSIAFGVVFLKERFSHIELIATVILLLGIFIFSFNGDMNFKLGLLYTLLSTLCYTGQDILSKTLSKKVSHNVTVSLRATVVTIAFCLFPFFFSKVTLSFSQSEVWLLPIIFIGGVSGVFLNKYLSFKALKDMSLSRFILISNTKPVIIFLLAALLLGEQPTLLKTIGAILITGAALVLGREHLKKKQEVI